jgi:hypothetical protein
MKPFHQLRRKTGSALLLPVLKAPCCVDGQLQYPPSVQHKWAKCKTQCRPLGIRHAQSLGTAPIQQHNRFTPPSVTAYVQEDIKHAQTSNRASTQVPVQFFSLAPPVHSTRPSNELRMSQGCVAGAGDDVVQAVHHPCL